MGRLSRGERRGHRPPSGAVHSQTVRWRRLDAAGREEASFGPAPGGWAIRGGVEVEEDGVAAMLRYEIGCDELWRTRTVSVTGTAGERRVELRLTSDGEGTWQRALERLPQLDGALDVDLGFTPATNTLPIRRLALPVGGSASVRTAWYRFPELRLEPLEQSYLRESERVYRFEALVDGELFSARLGTDDFGIVRHYEGLWEEEGQGG